MPRRPRLTFSSRVGRGILGSFLVQGRGVVISTDVWRSGGCRGCGGGTRLASRVSGTQERSALRHSRAASRSPAADLPGRLAVVPETRRRAEPVARVRQTAFGGGATARVCRVTLAVYRNVRLQRYRSPEDSVAELAGGPSLKRGTLRDLEGMDCGLVRCRQGPLVRGSPVHLQRCVRSCPAFLAAGVCTVAPVAPAGTVVLQKRGPRWGRSPPP